MFWRVLKPAGINPVARLLHWWEMPEFIATPMLAVALITEAVGVGHGLGPPAIAWCCGGGGSTCAMCHAGQ